MHSRLAIFAVVATALLQHAQPWPAGGVICPAGTAHARRRSQAHKSGAQKGTGTRTLNSEDLLLQRERLEFDKQKFASDVNIENKKLDIERDKLRIEGSSSKWSAVSAIAPWVIALFTLGFSLWSFRRQAQQQSAMQLAAAKLQFEIKAAELAFSGKTARAVANRAKALKVIFPGRLPDNFAKDFSPMDFGGDKEDPEGKKFLLELLLQYPEQKAEVFGLWAELFPGDKDWLDRVKALPEPPQAAQQEGKAPTT